MHRVMLITIIIIIMIIIIIITITITIIIIIIISEISGEKAPVPQRWFSWGSSKIININLKGYNIRLNI